MTIPTVCGTLGRMAREINTTDMRKATREAIEALGGHIALARLFDVDTRVISNWYVRGLPPETHYALAPLLRQRGLKFSPRLFRQRMIPDGNTLPWQQGRRKEKPDGSIKLARQQDRVAARAVGGRAERN